MNHSIPAIFRRYRDNASNLISLVAVNFVTAGLGFVTNVALADHLGSSGFGRLSYALAVGMVCMTVALFGMGRTFVREVIHFPDRARELVYGSFAVRVAVVAACAAGTLLLRRQLHLEPSQVLIVVATTLTALHLQGLYDAWGRIRLHAGYFFVQRAAYFALVWFLLALDPDELTLWSIGGGLLGATVLGLVLQYAWALPKLGGSAGVDVGAAARYLIRSNLWVWLGAIAGLSFVNLNQIVVKHFHGDAALGRFAACLLLVNVSNLFLTQIARIGAPGAARCTRPGVPLATRRAFLGKYLAVIVGASLVPALPCIVAPSRLLALFFTAEYGAEGTTLRLLGFYVVAIGVALVATQFMVVLRLEKQFFVLVAVAGGLSLVTSLVLVPRWSGYGAALSLLVVHSLTILASLALVLRKLSSAATGEELV